MTSDAVLRCRSCQQPDLRKVLDFGRTPLADRLLEPGAVSAVEPSAPLTLVFCPVCALLQLRQALPPGVIFGDHYRYYSSSIPSLLDYTKTNVEALCERYRPGPDSLVMEAASNDGYLLRHFLQRRIQVLGIDPCPGAVRLARDCGVPTIEDCFGGALARTLAATGVFADIFLANNVLAHVADPRDFVAGLREITKPAGVAVLEVHYVVPLVERNEFDTIYHQHQAYFSLTSLTRLFGQEELFINDACVSPIYGGTLRIHVGRERRPAPAVDELLADEARRGVGSFDYYARLATQAARTRNALRELLDSLKRQGRRVAGYGAPAKATTLMAFCDLDGTDLEYLVDINPHKQGLLMPGTHIPIRSPRTLVDDPPDYLLIFAWNYLEEVLAQQKAFLDRGGKFIVPIPEPRIVP